jgi:hypothetical protein
MISVFKKSWFEDHIAQTLEHRRVDQRVLGLEVQVDSALGDLRFLGHAVDRGPLHAVSS